MREEAGSTRRFGGNGVGCGFRSAMGVARGFARSSGGDLFFLFRFLFLGDLLGDLLAVVLVHNSSHVGAGFAKWRHSLILFDALGTGVVGGQRLDEIEIVALQKFAQIAASASDIGFWVEGNYPPTLGWG